MSTEQSVEPGSVDIRASLDATVETPSAAHLSIAEAVLASAEAVRQEAMQIGKSTEPEPEPEPAESPTSDPADAIEPDGSPSTC